jgi:tRNA U34 5-methylaminomethyl-2-thiouridine-forming methyltransferase MnmC
VLIVVAPYSNEGTIRVKLFNLKIAVMAELQDELFLTGDGSHSIKSGRFAAVTYHSRNGAVNETQTVFIEAGLHPKLFSSQPVITILECGFGTGLNALMTFLEIHKHLVVYPCKVRYVTVDLFPLEPHLVEQLNYPKVLKTDEEQTAIFEKMHACAWNKTVDLSPQFSFTKLSMNFLEISMVSEIDVIYYDAFAPQIQAELWDSQMLQRLYNALRPNGILTTYCAQSAFKRTLKTIGFVVEPLEGPPGKREMTRAIKSDSPNARLH